MKKQVANNNTDMPKESKWSALAKKAQSGDQKAYYQLLKDISQYIPACLSGTLANADWAEDITQEVLISVHKSLGTYSPDKPFKPWLRAIINFRRTDFLRKHYSQRDIKQDASEAQTFTDNLVTNPIKVGELKDIEDALNELPEKQRKVFELMKIEGYTAQEVANEMDMSVSAVKVSAHRTLKKLQEKLG